MIENNYDKNFINLQCIYIQYTNLHIAVSASTRNKNIIHYDTIKPKEIAVMKWLHLNNMIRHVVVRLKGCFLIF